MLPGPGQPPWLSEKTTVKEIDLPPVSRPAHSEAILASRDTFSGTPNSASDTHRLGRSGRAGQIRAGNASSTERILTNVPLWGRGHTLADNDPLNLTRRAFWARTDDRGSRDLLSMPDRESSVNRDTE